MNTTPADLNRRRRIGDALDALRLIDADDIARLDDDTLMALHAAVASRAMFTSREICCRQWSRCAAADLTATADTQWPDAIEETAA